MNSQRSYALVFQTVKWLNACTTVYMFLLRYPRIPFYFEAKVGAQCLKILLCHDITHLISPSHYFCHYKELNLFGFIYFPFSNCQIRAILILAYNCGLCEKSRCIHWMALERQIWCADLSICANNASCRIFYLFPAFFEVLNGCLMMMYNKNQTSLVVSNTYFISKFPPFFF